LARTPRRIAQQLSAAARACAEAAAELESMVWQGSAPSGPMDAAAEAARLSHRAAVASAHMLGGGLDRADVIAIARALQTLAGDLEEAASALRLVDDRIEPWGALTGVIRDGTREVAAAIDRLDGPADERDAHLDRADELYDEWRRLLHMARAHALRPEAEPAAAVVADTALRRLERATISWRSAARSVRTVAIKHA
jgi:hypothetical protein